MPDVVILVLAKQGIRRQFFVFLAACLVASSVLAEWHSDTQSIMGTRVHAEIWQEDAAVGQRVLAEIMAEMRRIDAAFSTFRETSELSRLNREAGKGWMSVSDELFELLQKSRNVSDLTNGAFDITYASVGRYYDYRAGERPDDETIRTALAAINYRYVELDERTGMVRYTHPDVYVDLGGIAKGHAVDLCAAILAREGIEQGTISAGGDSRVVGDRRGKPWTVGIRDPRREDAMLAVLPLIDTAVSTSGDYERFFEENGVRYHHILDPDTGDSARETRSVTVLGDNATFTDALSTSVFVLGPIEGLKLIDSLPGVDAIVIDAEGVMRYSAELDELTH
ncbi:MAG: FAD:protein FMN transferase [Gammaproteobacteria bacterium]|nr:FAD:protein FMN transferase [Gammaproteobacteria bacterium]